MKKLTLTVTAIIAAISSSTNAADVEGNIVKNPIDNYAFMQDDPLYFAPSDLSGIDPDTIKLTTPTKENRSSPEKISESGPAQGITYFEIAAVQSVTYPNIDPVSANQQTTNQNHGGGQVRVFVFQYGYGTTNNATFAGSSVAATSSSPRCGTNLTTCSVGQTVTGFLHQYDFFGASNVSGTVNVSANSTASPFGFWSDSVYIQ